MLTSRLSREEGKVVLWLDESRASLASDHVHSDLKSLASWLDCEPELRIGSSGDATGDQ